MLKFLFLLRRPQNVRIPGDFLPPNRKLAACDDVGKCSKKLFVPPPCFVFKKALVRSKARPIFQSELIPGYSNGHVMGLFSFQDGVVQNKVI